MARWVTKREIRFVDATISEGEILDGVEVSDLDHVERSALQKRKQRIARERPDVTILPVRFAGKIRWVHAPDDVRMHLTASGGGSLRRGGSE